MDEPQRRIAAFATTAFLVTTLSIEQWFVAAALALLLGALLGFSCFNFRPASIFMGDSGSLVIGFILGVLTVRTTFLPPGANFGRGVVRGVRPVIVLAVPLYDFDRGEHHSSVAGKSPFVGDTNHFSHSIGGARDDAARTAVMCLYLITAAYGDGGGDCVAARALDVVAAMLIDSRRRCRLLGVVARACGAASAPPPSSGHGFCNPCKTKRGMRRWTSTPTQI
jgi:hypothetical protein